MSMKKWFFAAAAIMAVVALNAQESMSLADARAGIGDCIKTPAKMTETMSKLSAEDQKAFLAEVNEAIAAMPGSNESQAATFLNVNRAALKGTGKGNLAEVLAEVFATVPPEVLPVITDSFASDLFNRAADPSVTYSDIKYIHIASNAMARISERMADVDGGAARAGFAAVMFVKASNTNPDGLVDALVSTLPADSRDAARNEWIPAATAPGESQSYEPLLDAVGASGNTPNASVVIRIAGPQQLDAMLGDLHSTTLLTESVFKLDKDFPLPAKETQTETVVIDYDKVPVIKEDEGYQNQY